MLCTVDACITKCVVEVLTVFVSFLPPYPLPLLNLKWCLLVCMGWCKYIVEIHWVGNIDTNNNIHPAFPSSNENVWKHLLQDSSSWILSSLKATKAVANFTELVLVPKASHASMNLLAADERWSLVYSGSLVKQTIENYYAKYETSYTAEIW